MGNVSKLIASVLMILFGIWLLLPSMSLIKPVENFPVNLVWWPNLFSVIKGAIPVGLLAFGILLFWIEFEEFRTPEIGGPETGETGSEEGEEMPAFEDVEYKDLECPECGEHFKTDIGLKVHRKVNHPEAFEENPEPQNQE